METIDVYCMGTRCPVKNTCKRYTFGVDVAKHGGVLGKLISKCTNQKKYVQDTENINPDSKRK